MTFWRHPAFGGLLLFLGCWLAFGALINARNMQDFNLQHIGIEAITERQQFWLEGSPTPQLQTRGDVFQYNNHTYAAKQPGQFMFGALAYHGISALGLRYRDDYLRTAAWVTFASASLILALGILAIQRLSRRWLRDYGLESLSYLTALGAAFGTTLLAYSGLPHHDLIASALMACAFACAFAANEERRPGYALAKALLAGLCLGLTITTSMLPFFSVLILGLYALWILTLRERIALLLGGTLGLLPLLFYNYQAFGNPLLMANVAGDFSDTFWHFELGNARDKALFYFRLSMQYMPIIGLGLWGTLLLPRHLGREKLAIAGATLASLTYLLGIETVGHCQYGPRYLLPLIPLLLLGLNGLWLSGVRRSAYVLVWLGLGYGVLLNIGGAWGGGMYCSWWQFGGAEQWQTLIRGQAPALPLLFLGWPAAVFGVLLALWVPRYCADAQS